MGIETIPTFVVFATGVSFNSNDKTISVHKEMTVRALYWHVCEWADQLCNLDMDMPMVANSAQEFEMINGWVIADGNDHLSEGILWHT